MLLNKSTLINMIKDDLNAGIVNLELSDTIIERNLDRSLFVSKDYFNYTDYKTVSLIKGAGSGSYVPLTDIDNSGGKVTIINVFPTQNVMNIDAALLGLGTLYINSAASLDAQLSSYSTMVNRLANLESILGRNARVVGDKLYLDKYYNSVTVEYIPGKLDIEKIHEGAWIKFLIEYTTALCKLQLAQSRGRYVVSSNPASSNAAELIQQATATIDRLEESLKTKGILLTTR